MGDQPLGFHIPPGNGTGGSPYYPPGQPQPYPSAPPPPNIGIQIRLKKLIAL